MEIMFYDELEPDNESPMPGAPVLEEEKGGGTYDLRDLLKKKRKKGSLAPQDPKNV